MRVVKVQFHKIDKEYFFLPKLSETPEEDIKVGDIVIVETVLGQDLGLVTGWADFQPSSRGEDDVEEDNKDANVIQQERVSDIKPILRKATEEDLAKVKKQRLKYPKYMKEYKKLADRHKLESMKLVDVNESFDEKRLTFYFIANSRVDFRELVKDLVKSFRRKIRLQQIGVRDAAKLGGDVGPCGLPLCCRAWLEVIGNVSPDYINDQELTHRGADRLTGVCGRLKCCLRYEEENYKYYLDNLPKIGDVIKTKAGKGKVVAVHALKHTVNLDIEGVIVEYPYLEANNCNGSCGGTCENCLASKDE